MLTYKRLGATILCASAVNLTVLFLATNLLMLEANFGGFVRLAGGVVVFLVFSIPVTGLGILAMIVVTRPIVARIRSSGLAAALVLIAGAVLGWLMAIGAPELQLASALFGLISAIIFLAVCSSWIPSNVATALAEQ